MTAPLRTSTEVHRGRSERCHRSDSQTEASPGQARATMTARWRISTPAIGLDPKSRLGIYGRAYARSDARLTMTAPLPTMIRPSAHQPELRRRLQQQRPLVWAAKGDYDRALARFRSRRSDLNPKLATAVLQSRIGLGTQKATPIEPSPTTTMQSPSIRIWSMPTSTEASPGLTRGTMSVPSPTSAQAATLDPNDAMVYDSRGVDLVQEVGIRPRHRRLSTGAISLDAKNAASHSDRARLGRPRGKTARRSPTMIRRSASSQRSPPHYQDRGLVHFYSGAAAEAQSDFRPSGPALEPDDAYSAIWLDLAGPVARARAFCGEATRQARHDELAGAGGAHAARRTDARRRHWPPPTIPIRSQKPARSARRISTPPSSTACRAETKTRFGFTGSRLPTAQRISSNTVPP